MIVWFWPNPRSGVVHAFSRGPGTGDAALCGAVLAGDSKPSLLEGDPRCLRCLRVALDGMTSDQWEALSLGERDALRDLSGLAPQLMGLEGWRVEVGDGVNDDGSPRLRRFYVGRSTGWRPCHLEIARRDSDGGFPANRTYDSVRALYRRDG